MLCKKCGAEIADASKFCGYCGETVVSVEETVEQVNDTNILTENNLGETIKIDPVQLETSSIPNQPVNEPVEPNQNVNKKNNKLLFVIGGIVLAIIAIVLVVFAMNNTESSISVLKKALANLEEKGDDSATVVLKADLGASGQTLSISVQSKVEKKSDDKYDMQLTVAQTLFTDEMNIYASVDKDNFTVYLESTLIDMIESTSSLDTSWVYYTLALNEIMDKDTFEKSTNDLNIEDIIDEKHFVYVDKVDGLKHYQLIIDQELVNTIKEKASEIADETMEDNLETLKELEKPIKIDFYITKSNELSKIELDMSDYFSEEDGISKLVMSIELKDLNSTKVEIPSEAKDSKVDLDTYITNNSDIQISECYEGTDCNAIIAPDYEYDFDLDDDSSFDMDFGFGY